MWTVCTLAILITCPLTDAVSKKIGACVIACTEFTLGDGTGFRSCPEGYQCRFNGCGRTCQLKAATSTRQIPICMEGCISGCPEGKECVFSGCNSSCQPIGTPSNGGCIDECASGCPEGYRCAVGSCYSACQKVDAEEVLP